ncbi:aldose epimerase family protein [Massilia horti]|uniref:Aldose 1-epimerase n=1 Tax=Massilia horti TaxID=2562153 RepID=A0A4Y9T406_9BURK|nr:aldose epimerase family protein [Massilia horti]TFW34643.1 galactose mutarotase [Massilia horti]
MQPGITQAPFGRLPGGEQVQLFTLTNANGMVVKITNFGGIITELHVPDRNGVLADVVHGFDTLEAYRTESPYFGATIGRYGNRIARGRFTEGGKTYQLTINDGQNHLHGGTRGFDKVLWQASAAANALTLTHRSPDGDQGYPGNLDATVVYSLTDDNELVMRLSATTSQPTPINLTQHSYFNLAGDGDILDHELTIDADAFIPIDAESIPLGGTGLVAGTPFDFRTPHAIGERIGYPDTQLRHGSGYDHCYVLTKPAQGAMTRALHARHPGSGRVLELFTQEPGVQFYSGNFLDGTLTGKGRTYIYRSGFCAEPQHFPDSPNHPAFPNTILRPGQVYQTESRYRFSVEK